MLFPIVEYKLKFAFVFLNFLVESHHQVDHREVTTPCNPNPCNMSQICEVSRRKCSSVHSCPQYICIPGILALLQLV